jgi:hypothetical protein
LPERRLPAERSLPGHWPAGEVALGGEAAHVGADLGQHGLGGAPLHARDRAEQFDRARERGELGLDLVGKQLDLLVEEVEVGKDRGHDQRMLGVEAADQRLALRRDLLAQLALRQLGQHVRVGGAGDERVQHRPAGGAEDVAGDAVELGLSVGVVLC